MAVGILIGGGSGTGKSTSLETLNPKETFIVNVASKPLPFRGGRANYTPLNKVGEGNMLNEANAKRIVDTLVWISNNRVDIKVVVIDDFQYVGSFEFFRRTNETGYTKFTDIGKNLFTIVTTLPNLREDLVVVLMNHLEVEADGFGGTTSKIKTIGKMVDQYLVVEGLFTVVLYTNVDKSDKKMPYGFITQNDGTNTVKSPKGMFDEERIPNDLGFVIEKVKEYNN